ncbi:MAG TPA: PH domain-containing protein [Thermoanaerobaculia bacterium]|jgi:membrane protein YdbS with pleckstrin-like domain
MPVITCPDCGRDVSTLAAACPHCGRPSPAGTAPMPAASPAALKEETLWRGTPSAKILLGQIVAIIAVLIIVPLITHFIAANITDLEASARAVRIGWWLTAIIVILQLVWLFIALARLRSTMYTVTNQRVMIEKGILSKSVGEIDLRYIDDTQFFQSLGARLLGIGNVTLVSSDKTSPVFVLYGVSDPRGVREVIRSQAYQVSQRQIFTRPT